MLGQNQYFNADIKNVTKCNQLNACLQKNRENEQPMDANSTILIVKNMFHVKHHNCNNSFIILRPLSISFLTYAEKSVNFHRGHS